MQKCKWFTYYLVVNKKVQSVVKSVTKKQFGNYTGY